MTFKKAYIYDKKSYIYDFQKKSYIYMTFKKAPISVPDIFSYFICILSESFYHIKRNIVENVKKKSNFRLS